MSRAEEQALKAYPNIKTGEQHIDQSPAREVYVQGYEQAKIDFMEKAKLFFEHREFGELYAGKEYANFKRFMSKK